MRISSRIAQSSVVGLVRSVARALSQKRLGSPYRSERADCSGCARGHTRGRGGGVLAILLCVYQFVGGGVAAGFVAAAEGWASGNSVSALRMIGRPSLPEPMTTIFALGDCASRRVASMPCQRR